jgi:F-type H+-transporting ATPase subunit a
MSASPIDQFVVKTIGSEIFLGNLNISFSNSALLMTLTSILIVVFFYVSLKHTAIVPSKLQMLSEFSYDFVAGIAKDNIGEKASKFFPFIYSIFLFFLFGNLLGVIPFSFAFTSQIVITLAVAISILIIATAYGIFKHGFKFLKLFIPTGVPLILLPLMFIIEIMSYLAKAFSMGVRLFANIMAGHIILEIFAGFIIALGIFGIIPLSFAVVLYGFELIIACLQAYIFTLLACLFFEQVINLH